MSEKPNDFIRFPPKMVRGVHFERLYRGSGILSHKDPDSGKWCARYPSVYWIDMPNRHTYARLYDHFSDLYFEGRGDCEGFISYRQYSLFNYLSSLSNRGYYVAIKGRKDGDGDQIKGLSALTGIRRPWLTDDLDHLEDCLLIHRVKRAGLHGQPNEIVIHTPFTFDELKNGKYELVRDRIARRATATRRESVMVRGIKDGQNFAYVPRNAAPGFWLDFAYLKAAFGKDYQRFADFALNFFRKNFHYLKTNKPAFIADYEDDLGLMLNLMNIRDGAGRAKCYKAAGVFRKIYCPTLEEIIAA